MCLSAWVFQEHLEGGLFFFNPSLAMCQHHSAKENMIYWFSSSPGLKRKRGMKKYTLGAHKRDLLRANEVFINRREAYLTSGTTQHTTKNQQLAVCFHVVDKISIINACIEHNSGFTHIGTQRC